MIIKIIIFLYFFVFLMRKIILRILLSYRQVLNRQNTKIMNYFVKQLQDKHIPIVNYFLKNGFGTNMPVLTYLSILKPMDRCIILEKLFEQKIRNIQLYDKMVLAYVKIGRPDLGKQVVDFARQMGESEFDCWGIEQKLDLGIPPDRTDQQRLLMIQDYLSRTSNPTEKEFLDLLIKFVNEK